MKLYDFEYAPNSRKVRVYLHEKGISIPVHPVNLMKGDQKSPEFLAKNPFGAVPVLELDDGTVLDQSLAIIEYLEELHPDPPMIGTTPEERARVRSLERAIDTSVLLRVARIFHNTRAVLPGAAPSHELAEEAIAGLARALRILEERIGSRPFAAGDRPTIADCTLFASFEMARMGDIDLGVGADAIYPNLDRWYEDFRKRPSASA